jgi:hypothetical protein
MVERNMIREGFIRNSATSPSNPTFSGSQIVNEQQMTALADENLSIAAVTVSSTEDIVLTADLGARWKLDRLELYTDEPTISNVTMEISDNDLEYFPVTLTGSPNSYVGDILDSTISGAPRYIRYKHEAVGSDRDVFEWTAINDDTLVDFGSDGNQTEAVIDDAPVGRPSDQVTTLALFNQYSKPGSAFVFIDNTGTDADELFEISTSANGPWFGRQVFESLQPENTPWADGNFQGTRVVAASGFYMNWDFWNSSMSWAATDMVFSSWSVDGAIGYLSTGSSPTFTSSSDYTDGLAPWATVTAGVGNIVEPHPRNVVIDTGLYDRIRLKMRCSPLAIDDIISGPRIYWRWVDDANILDPFPIENSSLSQFPFNNFTGQIQEFIFDVGSVTTWSGAPYNNVRGLSIEAFTAVTGTGSLIELFEVEAFHSSGQDRIVLEKRPTASGTRPEFIDQGNPVELDQYVTVPLNTRITEPCIVTKVYTMSEPSNADLTGCFLVRFREGEPGYNFPTSSGNNFEVKNTCRFRQITGPDYNTTESWVFWKAEPGDFIGYSQETTSSELTYRSAGAIDLTWRADGSEANNNTVSLASASACETDMNTQEVWASVAGRLYFVWFDSVPIGSYLANGTYTTPIFDGGSMPALMSSSFTAIETAGSSLDTNTSSAFKTINARASDTPPISSAAVGQEFIRPNWGPEGKYPDGQLPTAVGTFSVGRWINEEFDSPPGNDWMINKFNGPVSTREFGTSNTVKNLGGAIMYHQDNDEIWLMNVLLSGTYPADLRPIWDVYDPETLEYVRTDHVKGQINYGYESDNTSVPEIFEAVGFIWDDTYDEIHIIQRQPFFFVGTVPYYAITIDTQGNFLRCSWREDSVGGTATHWSQMLSVTFDETYFYALTSNSGGTSNGTVLTLIKRGDLQTGDNTIVTEVDELLLSSISGLEGADGSPVGQQCIYNPQNGYVYLFFGNPLSSFEFPRARSPEVYAIKVNIAADDTISSAVKIPLVDSRGVSVDDGASLAELGQIRNGYDGDWAGSDDDTPLITARDLRFISASTYDDTRDNFIMVSSKSAQFPDDWEARENFRDTNNRLYDKKTLQFFYSCSAGSSVFYADTPVLERGDDPVWGGLSGTLSYDSLQQDAVLFPTGRYAQIEYTLNSNPGLTVTPQILTSQLNQGIRVGTIPAQGTTNIYLRTDIPEDTSIGDRTGNLKVFWELPEA